MSGFTEGLTITAGREGKYWATEKDYSYDIGYEGSRHKVTIPKGFRFEGASIPKIFWSIVGHPMNIKVLRAALIHDWMYVTKKRSRKYADDVFFESMLVSGVGVFKASLFYWAVRVGGWYIWNKGLKKKVNRDL